MEMTLQQNSFLKPTFVLLLAILLVLSILIYSKNTSIQIINLPLVKNCDLNIQSCQVALPDSALLTISISPQPIPLVSPLDIKVKIEGGGTPNSLSIDFEGKDMNMGLSRYEFKPISENVYQAEGMLGICIRDEMVWKATLTINNQSQQYKLPFEFVTMKSY